jgi:hypothetical protein
MENRNGIAIDSVSGKAIGAGRIEARACYARALSRVRRITVAGDKG